ncbi:MAG: nucleoside phosphorylase [Prolixibacteraceae bacterium]
MIKSSELILNKDGSVFHLHLKPENIADQIILVGDQDRVNTISDYFDNIEFSTQNREFKSVTGWYKSTKLTVLSTGIGTDNIDIVMNELDALANIDLQTREIKRKHKSLNIVRIGTSGGLQQDLPVNAFVVSKKSVGFDGLLPFYDGWKQVCDLPFEKAFKRFTGWDESLPTPYVVDASAELSEKFKSSDYREGVTISAPGFYGPQGRVLRLELAMPQLNRLIEDFSFHDLKITNFEMESSAIYGLSKLLGHNALTVCLIIANRVIKEANQNYREQMKYLIADVLNRLTKE